MLWFLMTLAHAADGVTVRSVEHLDDTYGVVTVDLRRADLDLYGQSEDLHDFDALSAWLEAQGRRLVAATNAGIFDTDFRPLGLQVERGTEVHALNTAQGYGNFYLEPNGVFYIDGSGAHVVDTAACCDFVGDARLATQSGPLLVSGSTLHPAIREHSPNLLPRNGVGVSGPHTVHLVMSEGSVRFWELATLFRDVLGCPAALYLDGIVSGLRAEGLPESMGVTSRYGGILAVTAPLVPSPDPGAVGPDRPPATPSGPQPTPGDTE